MSFSLLIYPQIPRIVKGGPGLKLGTRNTIHVAHVGGRTQFICIIIAASQSCLSKKLWLESMPHTEPVQSNMVHGVLTSVLNARLNACLQSSFGGGG